MKIVIHDIINKYYAVILDNEDNLIFMSNIVADKNTIINLLQTFKDNILNAEIEDQTNIK